MRKKLKRLRARGYSQKALPELICCTQAISLNCAKMISNLEAGINKGTRD
jgi:hypothetical protein